MRVTHNPAAARRTAETLFGEQVRLARSLRGWSQEALAQRLRDLMGIDLHQTAIARLEHGQRPIRLNEFAALAQLLELDTSIYSGHGRPLTDEDYAVAKARVTELEEQVAEARRQLDDLRDDFFKQQRGREIGLQLLEAQLSSLRASIYSYEHADREARGREDAELPPFEEGAEE